MGVLGVGLQDAGTLRLLSARVSLWSENHERSLAELRDAIAAFSVHIAKSASWASSPVDVISAWPGQPDVVYDVVNGGAYSARVMVVYESYCDPTGHQEADEILQRMSSVVRTMESLRDITLFHELAGRLLVDPSDSQGFLQTALTARTDSEKPQVGGGIHIPKLLGRKSKSSAGADNDDPATQSMPSSGLKKILRRGNKKAPVETPVVTAPPEPKGPLRETQPLSLPETCFSMATVGAPLPAGPGDLVWFAQLLLDRDKDARPAPAVGAKPKALPAAGPSSSESAVQGPKQGPVSGGDPRVSLPLATAENVASSEPTAKLAAVPQVGITVDSPQTVGAIGETEDPGVGVTAMSSQEVRPEEELRNRMNGFANTIQEGNFPGALREIVGTLRFLAEMEGSIRERETHACVAYALAMQIIIRVKGLEAEVEAMQAGQLATGVGIPGKAAQMAVLTVFLAELPLVGKHKLVALKMAVDKAEPVGNYAVAARYLQSLVELAPEDRKAEFERRRVECLGRGTKNAIKPPSMRLCYRTLQLVGSPCLKCNFCAGLYHPESSRVAAGQTCPLCLRGSVVSLE